MDNQSKYKSKLGLVISLITISFVALNYVFYPNLIFAQLFTITYLILIHFYFNDGDIKKYMYYVTLLFSIINFSLILPINSRISLYYYYITLFIYFVIDMLDKIKTKQHIKFDFKTAFKSKYYNFFIIFSAYVVFSIILTVDKKLGLRTVFNYFIMFFYTAMIIKENKNLKDIKGTFNFFKLLYIGILIFGTLEIFGIRFGIRNHFVELGFSLKEYTYLNKIPVSFFFNPNNYAVVLVIAMIVTAISYCYSDNKNEKRMLIIIYAASQINLIFTTSRTCWVTIFIALALCYIFSLIKKEKKLQKTVLSYFLLTFLIFTVLSPIPYFEPYYGKFNTTPILNKLNIVHKMKNPNAPKAKKIELGGEGSNSERFTLIYDVFHGVFTEKHLLGFGAGNISCYIKSMNNTFGVLNVHSLWFEILGDFGVGIFIYYVLTYSLLLLDLFKSWRKKEQGDIKNYTLMILVCLFAFVFLVFAPSTVVAYVPYWTVIGISFALILNKKVLKGNKMNVLIVTSWYPNDKSQIAGVFIKEQAKALLKAGLNPIVLFPYDNSIDKKQLKYNIEDGIPTYRANTDYMKNSFISKANSLIKTKKLIKKIVIKEDIDIIHSHVCYPSGFAVYFYSMSSKIPYVITEHMSTIYDFQKKFYNRFLFKKSYKNARRVITVSSFLKDELKNMGFHFNSEIIPNVVDAADYEINKKSNKNSFNILFIGRMDYDEVKGIKYLIPAFANAVNKNKEYNLKLILVGDGAKRGGYEKLSKDFGIENNCDFVGGVSKQSVPYYISNCDFLVLPSIKETFGSVLIEAMAGGKPVLATNCGGPNDIVNDKVGILVEKENVNALEKGIDDMIQHYDEFDSNYIRNEVHNKYSYEAVGNKLKNLYLNILEK